MPRLDRHLSKALSINRRDVRYLLAQGRVTVDGSPAMAIHQVISPFSAVHCDGKATQLCTPRYVMLNKPPGVVSATRDDQHTTIIDLLDQPWKNELHIAGRLDFNSTGLLLLTNDGRWSRRLSDPAAKLIKRYRVRVVKPLSPHYVEAFRQGMYFRYENITTQPARLTIRSECEAEVALTEGRYHQIKRMFGRFDNKVLSIHRVAVGSLELDGSLAPGQSRALTESQASGLLNAQPAR